MSSIHSLNMLQLIGRVGREPQQRDFSNGGQVVEFGIATTEDWRDKESGEWKSITQWHNVKIFGEHLARVAMNNLTKGTKVYISGPMKSHKYTKEGETSEREYWALTIGKFDGDLKVLERGAAEDKASDAPVNQDADNGGDFNDDIPF